MHLSNTGGFAKVEAHKFPDGENHCVGWYSSYWGIFWGTLAVAGVISLINILSEVFI